MSLPSDAVLALIDRHLATSAPPCDPGGHYDTYAPAAFVVIGSQVMPKGKAARSAYVSAWTRLLPALPADTDLPRFERAETGPAVRDAQGLRLVTRLTEAGSGKTFQTAWLLEGPDNSPLIRAVCPLDGDLPSADGLIARSLAELAHWGNHFEHPVWPLSPLGVAYARLHGTDPLPLESLPEARFTCQNRGDCCRMGSWTIPVDPNTQRALAAIPWSGLGSQEPRIGPVTPVPGTPGPAYGIMAGSTGHCEAHVGDRCTVHEALGWQPIHTCQVFPYQFQMAPDAIIVSASFMCETVGENQGQLLHEQAADIQNRLRPVSHLLIRLPEDVPLYLNGPTIPWARFRQWESRMLAMLADRDLGDLASRVQAISVGLGRLIALVPNGAALPDDVDTVLDGRVPSGMAFGTAAADDWFRQMHSGGNWDQPQKRPFDGWQREAWDLGGQETIGTRRDDELATRYIRTLLFRKLGLNRMGIAFVWGLTAMAACFWDRHTVYRHRQEGLPIDRALQLDTAKRLDHSFMHTPLVQAFAEDAVLVRQLCDPRTWLSFSAAAGAGS
jgi:hypothetical protein